MRSVHRLVVCLAAALASVGVGQVPSQDLGGLLDPGDGFVLVENADLSYHEAFPYSPSSDVLVQRRNFVDARRRTWLSVDETLTASVITVDLGNPTAAEQLLSNPLGVAFGAQSAQASPVEESRQDADGSVHRELAFNVGRWLHRIVVDAAPSATSAARAVEQELRSQLLQHDPPAPQALVDGKVGDALQQPLVLAATWWVIASIVVLLRDRSLYQRVFGALRPRRVDPPLPPGFERRSVTRAATRRRLKAAVIGFLGFLGRALGALLVAAGLAALVSTPVAGLGLLVLVVALWIGVPRLVRQLQRDRADQHRYRTLVRTANPTGWTLINLLVAGAIVVFVASMFASGLLLWFAEGVPGPDEEILRSYAQIASGLFVFGAATLVWPWRRIARSARIGIDRTVRLDGRPPVLLLRSWNDDNLKLRTRRGSRHSLVERLSLRRFDRFEETVAWSLWRVGPVVAVAQPGSRDLPLGAARDALPQDDWQQPVQSLIEAAGLIVMSPAATESVGWEIDQLHHLGALARTIFLIAPVKDEAEAAARIAMLARVPGLEALASSQVVGNERVLAVRVTDTKAVQVITGRVRDDISYEVALAEALKSLPPPQPRPPMPLLPGSSAPARSSRLRDVGAVAARSLPAFLLFATGWIALLGGAVEARLRLDPNPSTIEANGTLPGVESYPPPHRAVATDSAGDLVLSADASGRVQLIDYDGGPEASYEVELGIEVSSLSVSRDMASAASLSGDLVVLWPVHEPDHRISVSVEAPFDIAVTAGGAAAAQPKLGQVTVVSIDGTTSTISTGGEPLAIDADRSRLAVVDAQLHRLLTLDPESKEPIAETSVCSAPVDVAITSEHSVVACGDEPGLEVIDEAGVEVGFVSLPMAAASVAAEGDVIAVVDREGTARIVEGLQAGEVLRVSESASAVAIVGDLVLIPDPADKKIVAIDLGNLEHRTLPDR